MRRHARSCSPPERPLTARTRLRSLESSSGALLCLVTTYSGRARPLYVVTSEPRGRHLVAQLLRESIGGVDDGMVSPGSMDLTGGILAASLSCIPTARWDRAPACLV